MASKEKIDTAVYEYAKDQATLLEGRYGQRNSDFDTYKDIYLLNWSDKPEGDDIKETISPDGRNVIKGAYRLMIATDPQFKVVGGKNDDISDKIEAMCSKWWAECGRISGAPVHFAAVESALLFGECHIALSSTAEMVERQKKIKGKNTRRSERLAAAVPIMFEVWNPRDGYPLWDAFGLTSFYRKVKVTANDVIARFGDAGLDAVGDRDLTDEVDLSIFYDETRYVVWVDDSVIIAKEHDLPLIPITAKITEGSSLFAKPEERRQPILYTIHKTNLWKRQNLALTVLFTNVFNLGVNPTFVHTAPSNNPDKKLTWDASVPGGVIDLEPGERLEPMIRKGIIDESFAQAIETAERKGIESTMYRQTLGEPLSGSPSFSLSSMMSQSGRLPLIQTQRMCGEAIAGAMEDAIYWYKDLGQAVEGYMKPSEIPDNIQLEVTLEVDLPQDKLQMANIANMLASGDDPITSKEWVRDAFLQMGQTHDEDEKIFTEKATQILVQQYLQSRVQQEQMRLQQQQQQQQMQAQQQQGMPPQGMPQQGPPQGPGGQQIPPEILAQMQAQGGQPPQGDPRMMGAGGGPGVQGPGFDPGMGGLPPGAAGQLPIPGGLPPEEQMP